MHPDAIPAGWGLRPGVTTLPPSTYAVAQDHGPQFRGVQRRSPEAKHRDEVFALLRANKRLTSRQIIDRTGISARTVQHYMQAARDEGLIE